MIFCSRERDLKGGIQKVDRRSIQEGNLLRHTALFVRQVYARGRGKGEKKKLNLRGGMGDNYHSSERVAIHVSFVGRRMR